MTSFDALATFLAVASAGNFSRAARAQGVAVSSIARAIDALEADLGAPLFIRSSRRMLLTDAGELFVPRARGLVAELARARASLIDLDDEPRGLLTVTAPALFGRLHVVPAIDAFLRRYPLIEIALDASDAVINLAVRRVDVAIRMVGTPAAGDHVATRLATVHRIACASPVYLARRGSPSEPSELPAHECLTVASPPAPPGWWCFAGANREAPLAVRGRFRSDDTGALLDAALAGLGIVHLASWLVAAPIAGCPAARTAATRGASSHTSARPSGLHRTGIELCAMREAELREGSLFGIPGGRTLR